MVRTVTSLAQPRWDRAQSAQGREVWERAVRPVAAWIEAHSRELARRIGDQLQDELPELFGDPYVLEENRASTEAGLLLIAELLDRGDDPRAHELRPGMLAYARDGAQAGVPLVSLFRGYRIGFSVLWDAVMERLAASDLERAELVAAIELCSAWLMSYADAAQTLGESIYVDERERWLRSSAATQAETIGAILDGSQTDVTLAGTRLRHDLRRDHVGVLAWVQTAPDGDVLPGLEAALDAVAGRLGAEGALLWPRGRSACAAWLSRRAPYVADDLERLTLATTAFPGVRLALGEPGQGLAGFRRTHEEAVHARRVATLAQRPEGSVTRYGRVAISAMTTLDPAQARRFVRRELAALAGQDDATRRLAATLRVYLEEQSSRAATARRLGLHENTIRYRIRKAEQLLGHGVEERTLEVRVALMLAGVVGT